jgi:hypothetical protein
MKENPAFIVDGFTEKNIIDKICPNRPIRRTDLNGKDVTLDAIADRLSSYIRLFNNKYYPIIIIIDKENRTLNCEEISKYLKEKLDLAGFNNQDIRISIADKMVENWLIADVSIFKKNEIPNKIDGINGASILKKKFGSYSKSTDCLKIVKTFNPSIAYKNSNSFKSFIDKIEDIQCYFTQFEK